MTGATFVDAATEFLGLRRARGAISASMLTEDRSMISGHRLPAFGRLRVEDVIPGLVIVFAMATAANAASDSHWENYLMAPVALVLCGLCAVVARTSDREAPVEQDSREAAVGHARERRPTDNPSARLGDPESSGGRREDAALPTRVSAVVTRRSSWLLVRRRRRLRAPITDESTWSGRSLPP